MLLSADLWYTVLQLRASPIHVNDLRQVARLRTVAVDYIAGASERHRGGVGRSDRWQNSSPRIKIAGIDAGTPLSDPERVAAL